MLNGLIFLDWRGRNTSAMERMVLHSASVKALQSGGKDSKLYFTHPCCDGLLTNKGNGMFGAIRGTVFHADLDETNGEARMVEFLLRSGSENLIFDPDVIGISVQPIMTEEGPIVCIEEVVPDDDARIHSMN